MAGEIGNTACYVCWHSSSGFLSSLSSFYFRAFVLWPVHSPLFLVVVHFLLTPNSFAYRGSRSQQNSHILALCRAYIRLGTGNSIADVFAKHILYSIAIRHKAVARRQVFRIISSHLFLNLSHVV